MRRRSPSRFFPVEAEQLLQAGDLTSATELCKYGLVYFPENISGYAVLAQAYLMLEQSERALNVLEDGYRRTGAEGLKNFCDIIREAEDELRVDGELRVESEELESEVAAGLQPAPEIVETAESNESKVEESGVESEELESGVAAGLQPAPGIVEIAESNESEVEELESGVAAGLQPAPETVETTESDDLIVEESEIESEIPAADNIFNLPDEEDVSEFRFVVESYLEVREEVVTEGGEERREANLESESEVEEATSIDFPFFINFESEPEKSEEVDDSTSLLSEREEPLHAKFTDESESEGELSNLSSEEESIVEEEGEEVREDIPAPSVTPLAVADSTEKIEQGEREGKQTTSAPAAESGEPIELSIHSGTRISRLRSSNLRLIPGLEFAPLRRDEPKLRIAPLVQPLSPEPESTPPEPVEPPQPEATEQMPEVPTMSADTPASEAPLISGLLPQTPFTSSAPMTPLEELARRLETARIPIVEGETRERESTDFEPSIVSETFAGILVKQGAYQEAIKAYQMLSRLKPERRADFEQKIEEVRWKMTNVVRDGGESES